MIATMRRVLILSRIGLLITSVAMGDRERSVKMWEESLAIATELGMKPLVKQIIARKKILKAYPVCEKAGR